MRLFAFLTAGSVLALVLAGAPALHAQQANPPATHTVAGSTISAVDSSALWPQPSPFGFVASCSSSGRCHDFVCRNVVVHVFKDPAGVPQATISATSYVREDVHDRAQPAGAVRF